MSEREHDRLPYAVQVEFRTASSFLVAYSVNLSRGGLFLETEADLPGGVDTTITMHVPGVAPIELQGVVAWRRGVESAEGPPGIGIELTDTTPLNAIIDSLVSKFHGVHILVLSGDRQDRTTLARSIKSIIATAEIMQAADASVAAALMTTEVDLAVIDVDYDADGGLKTLQAAKALNPPVPTVAITSNPSLREHARVAGADELATNPPPFAELQVVLMRALSKPVVVRGSGPHKLPPTE
ncbi:MAG: TIGR02266 family protein [Myxococcales bacterium]|nr:TIGR02266 family protein [Myxococcales bacterium]